MQMQAPQRREGGKNAGDYFGISDGKHENLEAGFWRPQYSDSFDLAIDLPKIFAFSPALCASASLRCPCIFNAYKCLLGPRKENGDAHTSSSVSTFNFCLVFMNTVFLWSV